jgi:hypothetical protein
LLPKEHSRKEAKNIPVSFDFLGYTFKSRICARAFGQGFWGLQTSYLREKSHAPECRDK